MLIVIYSSFRQLTFSIFSIWLPTTHFLNILITTSFQEVLCWLARFFFLVLEYILLNLGAWLQEMLQSILMSRLVAFEGFVAANVSILRVKVRNYHFLCKSAESINDANFRLKYVLCKFYIGVPDVYYCYWW